MRASRIWRPTRFLLLVGGVLLVVLLRSNEALYVAPAAPLALPHGAWLRPATPQELRSVSIVDASHHSGAVASSTAIASARQPALSALHPNFTLARLRARGRPFVDDWNRWPAPPCLLADWEAVASQSLSVNSDRWKISAIWNPHGFGSNFVSHSNFIIFAMFHVRLAAARGARDADSFWGGGGRQNATMVLVKRKDVGGTEFLTADEATLESQRRCACARQLS